MNQNDAEGGTTTPELPDTRPPAGEPWESLLASVTRPVAGLVRESVPEDPGVYLWRHQGRIAYVGTASNLRARVWGRHLGGGRSLGSSSLRRDVAEFLLGIPTTETMKGRRKLEPDQVQAVLSWLRACDISWCVTSSAQEAADLETNLRRAWWPPLNRI